MILTDAELKRALSLQKRLKLLRALDKLGPVARLVLRPLKNRREEWLRELTILYHKKFSDQAAQNYADKHIGNPISKEHLRRMQAEAYAAAKQFDSILALFNQAYQRR